jgi:hypothetical protein
VMCGRPQISQSCESDWNTWRDKDLWFGFLLKTTIQGGRRSEIPIQPSSDFLGSFSVKQRTAIRMAFETFLVNRSFEF